MTETFFCILPGLRAKRTVTGGTLLRGQKRHRAVFPTSANLGSFVSGPYQLKNFQHTFTNSAPRSSRQAMFLNMGRNNTCWLFCPVSEGSGHEDGGVGQHSQGWMVREVSLETSQKKKTS